MLEINKDENVFQMLGKMLQNDTFANFDVQLYQLLNDCLDPDNIILLIYKKKAKPVIVYSWIPNTDLKQKFNQLYLSNGYLLDPFYLKTLTYRQMKGENNIIHTLKEIAPDRFFQSEYYKQYFNITGMIDEMGCFIRISKNEVAELSLGRLKTNHKFTKREKLFFNRLMYILKPILFRYISHFQGSLSVEKSTNNKLDITQKIKQPGLTKREAEVARYILQGHSSLSISLHLNIAEGTVKVHRRNLFSKLKIHSQAQLYALFIKL